MNQPLVEVEVAPGIMNRLDPSPKPQPPQKNALQSMLNPSLEVQCNYNFVGQHLSPSFVSSRPFLLGVTLRSALKPAFTTLSYFTVLHELRPFYLRS